MTRERRRVGVLAGRRGRTLGPAGTRWRAPYLRSRGGPPAPDRGHAGGRSLRGWRRGDEASGHQGSWPGIRPVGEPERGAAQAGGLDKVPAVGTTGDAAARAVVKRQVSRRELAAVSPAALAELGLEVHVALQTRPPSAEVPLRTIVPTPPRGRRCWYLAWQALVPVGAVAGVLRSSCDRRVVDCEQAIAPLGSTCRPSTESEESDVQDSNPNVRVGPYWGPHCRASPGGSLLDIGGRHRLEQRARPQPGSRGRRHRIARRDGHGGRRLIRATRSMRTADEGRRPAVLQRPGRDAAAATHSWHL